MTKELDCRDVVVPILRTYLASHLTGLSERFSWRIPAFEGFQEGSTDLEKNIALRRHLSAEWSSADAVRKRLLVKWYVSQFGGVKRNKPETIEAYAAASEEDLAYGRMKGVASWSKVLAMRNPVKFVIFDARVSAALNAIQVLSRGAVTIYFPFLPTQNGRLKKARPWFEKNMKTNARHPNEGAVYSTFIDVLNAAIPEHWKLDPPFPGSAIEVAEMILFSDGPELAAKAVGSRWP